MYEQHFRLNVSEIEDFNTDLRGELRLFFLKNLVLINMKLLKDKLIIKKLMKKLSIKDVITEIKKIKIYQRRDL